MSDERAYTENERRLLTIAAEKSMLLKDTAETAGATIRELVEEIRRRDERLAAIAFRARTAIDDLDADGVDDLNALLDIESVASGEPRKGE